MIESLTVLLQTLSTLSPLAVIGLLSIIIYMMVYKQPSKDELEAVKSNHLHELPQMAQTLRRIEISTGHIDVRVGELERWRGTIRSDMHEISDQIGGLSKQIVQLDTLMHERTERRQFTRNEDRD